MQFYDDLAQQLAAAERRLEEERLRPAPAATARRRWRPRLALGGTFAMAVAVVVFAVLSVSPNAPKALAGLAILDAPAKDASGKVTLPETTRRYANLRSAHPFPMPDGREGYVFLSRPPSGELVCVAVPDPALGPDEPGGVACKPRAQAERSGLTLHMVPEAPDLATAIVVLPVGGTVVRFKPRGSKATRTYPSVNGVTAFTVPSDGIISWTGAKGRTYTSFVKKNFVTSGATAQCRDGAYVRTSNVNGDVLRALDDKCRKRGSRRK